MLDSAAVLGAGNGGLAFAGYLASRGLSVSLYNRTASVLDELRRRPEIRLHGQLSARGRPDLVTGELAEAVRGRQVVLVTCRRPPKPTC